MKRFAGILLLLLANICVLAHSAVPHHHHFGWFDDLIGALDDACSLGADHHQQSHEGDCVAEVEWRAPQNVQVLDCDALSACSPLFGAEPFALCLDLFRVACSVNLPADCALLCKGLRAPPVV